MAYINFFVKMDDTETKHLTALEIAVSEMVKTENYNFFPNNRAISVSGIKAKSTVSSQDTKVLEGLTSILLKLKQEVLFGIPESPTGLIKGTAFRCFCKAYTVDHVF